MTTCTLLTRAGRCSALVLFFLATVTVTSQAAGAPDSTTAIQARLPDSLSIEGKVVYVDFWASWCGPCRQSFPWMQALFSRYQKQGLEVVAVGVDKDHRKALDFLKDTKATFPVIFDSTGSLAKKYGLEAMPTSFVYGRNGRLVAVHQGFDADMTDSLEHVILQLLNEGKPR
jgi:cytochrome c biogenesis protein CcmG/thiol:disulfide interchange protein DsbE